MLRAKGQGGVTQEDKYKGKAFQEDRVLKKRI